MGRERKSHKYTCLECYYGCKGHEISFEGHTTSMTARLHKDDKPITPYLLYDDIRAIYKVLGAVFGTPQIEKEK